VVYKLNGRVDVGIDTGADGSAADGAAGSLTIEPGVTVFGADGGDFLLVNRGSQIIAQGSVAAPIVFTSQADLLRQADADSSNDDGGSANGEWGGLVLLGQAPINRCDGAGTPGTVDCQNKIEGVVPDAVYGGADPNDDSGVLSYVQVRFAGFPLPGTEGNELNGISFGGVGANTEVDFVQVHNNADDGIEFFGGTVNASHIVLTGNDDDSLDTDNGYQGSVQFVLVSQRADGGDNIVEASSVEPGLAPLSDANVANFTFVGNRSNAWRLNTGTIGNYLNGVVDYGQACFRWQDSAGDGFTGYAAGLDPEFNSVLFDCDGGVDTDNSDGDTAQEAIDANPNNVFGASSLVDGFFPGAAELAVTAADLTAVSSFFVDTDYIGAFAPTESVSDNWASGWTFALFDLGCPSGTADTAETLNGKRVCSISGELVENVTLNNSNVYEIDGRVDIGQDVGADGSGGDGAVLTIGAGVTLFGDEGGDYIVVSRGSQIFSNGTAANPVVFTSRADLEGTQADPANANGEWGGLVILGRAPINRCDGAGTPGTADCQNKIEGVVPDAVYGGAVADDDSGSIRYTQVKFAGFPLPGTEGNELNGISFGGVGSGTEVDFVQVHNNADDGVEFFGGTVNASHLVLTGNDDDSLDTDNGYQGAIQYMLVTQRELGGDNIVEASSVEPGLAPLSNANVANFTFIGNRSNAFRLNTGTVGRYVNGVVSYGQACFRWQDSAGDGVTGYTAGVDPSFDSVLFDCEGGIDTDNSDGDTAADAIAAGSNNSTDVADTLAGFVNGTAESAVTAFDATTLSSFFEPVDYIGAVRDDEDTWWSGWSCGLEAETPC